MDVTPTAAVWRVDHTGPVVSILPVALSVADTSVASFVFTSTKPYTTTFVYQLQLLQSSSWINATALLSSTTAEATLTRLAPGATYRLVVYGVDNAGNVGANVATTWTTPACVPPDSYAQLAVTDLVAARVAPGQRFVQWRAVDAALGYQYAVDGSNWTFTSATQGAPSLVAIKDCPPPPHACHWSYRPYAPPILANTGFVRSKDHREACRF